MVAILPFAVMFVAKVTDNALCTAKAIFVQRNRWFLAGTATILSNYLYFWITKNIIGTNNDFAIAIVSIASGVGCWLAMAINNRISKDKTYINVIMSDDREAMQQFRDFLAEHHIINVATDSYTRDWNTQSITITAYAETKEEIMLINHYIEDSSLKFKRVIQKG